MANDPTTSPPGRVVWIGRILSGLVAAMLVMSATMKFTGSPELIASLDHLGIPVALVPKLAVLELSCVLLYVLPRTAVLGAVLLTGYLGGAIFAHVRVGDPFIVVVMIGVVAWGALFLRDPRLRRLLPLRFPEPPVRLS